jgi:perosamine synthetase
MALRIHYTKPSIGERELRYAADAAEHGWGARCYEYIERFERAFADHLGLAHAIATSSCTGALELGFAALGIRPGDEVILADTNWVASVAPLVHLGAKPVFVDILPDSWCLDPDAVERAISPRTKAILAVHLYGNLCDMDRLAAIAGKSGIALVEDAAEAIGSTWRGKRAGSMGRFGCFSFHGSKTLTTGEGGMFVTGDAALFERALTLSNHGRARGEKRPFWPAVVGYKFKMSNLQAAIGLAQLERVDELVARKQAILRQYRNGLAGLPLSLNPPDHHAVSGAWMPTAVFEKDSGVTAATAAAVFAQNGIDARPFFAPLSSTGLFGEQGDPAIGRDLFARAINLPSYHDMTADDIDRVCSTVLRCIDG